LKQVHSYKTVAQQPTKVLLQAGHEVVIFGCSSLSASVSAGQAPLGFGCYLLLYNFIQQRLGADTAMNSLPAAIPNRCASCYSTHSSNLST